MLVRFLHVLVILIVAFDQSARPVVLVLCILQVLCLSTLIETTGLSIAGPVILVNERETLMYIGYAVLLNVVHVHLVVSDVIRVFVGDVDVVVLLELFDVLPALLQDRDAAGSLARERDSQEEQRAAEQDHADEEGGVVRGLVKVDLIAR